MGGTGSVETIGLRFLVTFADSALRDLLLPGTVLYPPRYSFRLPLKYLGRCCVNVL